MPSQAMQDVIDALRDRQKANASQAPPTLEERRAAFVPGDRLHPVPDDVLVTEVTAGGVPAHWLAAPGADTGRVLLFLHGGGYEFGSLRSDGELAARLGRASGMRVLFPEYRLAPEHPFPAALDDVLAAWRWLRADQDLSARSIAVAGDSAGGGLAVALLVATRDAGEALPSAAALMSRQRSDVWQACRRTSSWSREGAPRLPAARHPRGSRGHRADRKVPAGPGSLTRQSIGRRLPQGRGRLRAQRRREARRQAPPRCGDGG